MTVYLPFIGAVTPRDYGAICAFVLVVFCIAAIIGHCCGFSDATAPTQRPLFPLFPSKVRKQGDKATLLTAADRKAARAEVLAKRISLVNAPGPAPSDSKKRADDRKRDGDVENGSLTNPLSPCGSGSSKSAASPRVRGPPPSTRNRRIDPTSVL